MKTSGSAENAREKKNEFQLRPESRVDLGGPFAILDRVPAASALRCVCTYVYKQTEQEPKTVHKSPTTLSPWGHGCAKAIRETLR